MFESHSLNSEVAGNVATLVDLLSFRAAHQPRKLTFTFLKNGETEVGRLTYQELDRQARAIAIQL